MIYARANPELINPVTVPTEISEVVLVLANTIRRSPAFTGILKPVTIPLNTVPTDINAEDATSNSTIAPAKGSNTPGFAASSLYTCVLKNIGSNTAEIATETWNAVANDVITVSRGALHAIFGNNPCTGPVKSKLTPTNVTLGDDTPKSYDAPVSAIPPPATATTANATGVKPLE
ncbi:hypothetical protein [Niemeyer virus]|uniref:Uncharacterized protein R70 n=1 Tax=Acanthamoeba polyphaga mimivirus TaxID=212035 RepID=YR070_MIMIV|nr:RecName: Full=Uncharacterized protein R70 [Acanthamoeba polyphaga mimivirus]AAV50345.1 unknown [Acanthamoeba polyphaga mimivirus]ALR83584.1 hypothetical protein [Niemeyer virus]